jgi:hypothetical protein
MDCASTVLTGCVPDDLYFYRLVEALAEMITSINRC